MAVLLSAVLVVASLAACCVALSIHSIGPNQVGLVAKRFSLRRLEHDDPVAFRGEAGYQSELLMPGLRFRFWPVFRVDRHPWVQVPAGEIGVVIAQVGAALPIGAKSAHFAAAMGNFSNVRGFLEAGGQKGVQRPVLTPGTLLPLHPVAFLVITASEVFGVPVSDDLAVLARRGMLVPATFGLEAEQLRVTVIAPQGGSDVVGLVTVLEGDPLPPGDIASRLDAFFDVAAMEATEATDAELIERLMGTKNELHNNYQDFQGFLDHGGRIGLQHDPLLYGAYLLNPFLVRVELVPMLVVRQGEVAVVKSFVGLPTLDTSGVEFKHGSIVRPGHRGIWREPLRTGKYAVNPRCYAAEIVPTSILNLNWARQTSSHNLDANLAPIEGKSREGFVFTIELQVQIHVPDTRAPKVISMVGTMQNLVNEVLQAAVGNHFRNTLQDQEAIRFIETRMEVQEQALHHVTAHLELYEVETKGVYIQNVEFPPELVEVLTQREIAKQERATFEMQQEAQTARIEMERARGTADMQGKLSASAVNIEIHRNAAQAREAQAKGEATYVEATGLAEARATEALGLAKAEGFRAQQEAIGELATALVAVAGAIADGNIKVVPEVLVTGSSGGVLDALGATLLRNLHAGGHTDGRGDAAAVEVAGADEAQAPPSDSPARNLENQRAESLG